MGHLLTLHGVSGQGGVGVCLETQTWIVSLPLEGDKGAEGTRGTGQTLFGRSTAVCQVTRDAMGPDSLCSQEAFRGSEGGRYSSNSHPDM